jgi:hypothetical protein
MGQLRNTIRTMVRNEFAKRMLEEAKKGSYTAKTVYRASKYIDLWNDIPKGRPTKEVTPTPTKYDFVRRVMKEIERAASSTEKLYLKPEVREEVLNMLRLLVNNPDEFIETLNKERELVFGQIYTDNVGGNLRSSPDPVAVLVQEYLEHKDVLKSMEHVEGDAPAAEKAPEEEGEYDIIPGTTSKADIARMLASDPTETTTEMSVFNRIKKGVKRLTNEQNMAILEFIKDPDMDSADKKDILTNIEKLTKLIGGAAQKYSEMFIDAHIAAAKGIKDVENFDQVEKARTQGNKKFVDALKAAGVFSTAVNRNTINPAEYNVFDAVLDTEEGRYSVGDMVVIAAKKPEQAALFRDEAVASAKDTFADEMNKQTNFNTLGDYTDSLPAAKEIRQNIFKTLEKRGRKAGSTKEVLAAKKASAKK